MIINLKMSNHHNSDVIVYHMLENVETILIDRGIKLINLRQVNLF